MINNINTLCRGLCLLLATIYFVSLSSASFAETSTLPLKPDKAFSLSVSVTGKNTLNVEWEIALGYYLYQDRMLFTSKEVAVDVDYPVPMRIKSAEGESELVYANQVSIPLVLKPAGKIPELIQLTIKYQGCAKTGFCYPPMQQIATVNMNTFAVSYQQIKTGADDGFSLRDLLIDHHKVKKIFSTEHFAVTLFVFLMLGVLLAFTPCVLPMLPILTGIILGQKNEVTTWKAFLLSFTYVLGVSSAYACAGIVASMMGSSLQVWMQKPVFIITLAFFLVLLALSLFEFYDLPISRRWQNGVARWSARHEGGTFVGVFFMGIFSTLIVSPCITAPMIGVLLYIAQTGNLWFGATTLFFLGLGTGIPLIIVGMSAGKILPKSGPWMRAIVKLFGLVLVGMAIWVLSRLLPHAVTIFISGIYFIGLAVFMVSVMPAILNHKFFCRSLGVGAALFGVILMLNAVGYISYFNKITGSVATTENFIIVHNETQLKAEINKAIAKNLPILVDFYADWCESCVVMDKKVFELDRIQYLLKDFVLIRADLTDNNAEDQDLLKKYDVIAPPTIIFFTNKGDEVNSRRIVGDIDADEFAQRINAFKLENCDRTIKC